VQFALIRDGASVGPVTAFYESIAGTALPGDHFEPASGKVPPRP
jgi:hypothetical protein